MTKVKTKLLFLDRDGTIINHVNYLNDPTKVVLKENAGSIIKEMQDLGFEIHIVTNQSLVARGLASLGEVKNINDKVLEKLRGFGVEVKSVEVCPHLPQDGCICRKPKTLMGDRIIAHRKIDREVSFVIGDNESDIIFGKNLGFNTIKLAHDVKNETIADRICHDWTEISSYIRSKIG